MIDVTGMLKANERDKLSASAQASRNAVGRTWREYHTKVFALRLPGVSPAPFPLAVHAKKGGGCPHEVRGVQDAALATLMQIERGNDWTQQLAREFKLAARYVRDGNQQHTTSERQLG